MAAVGELVAGVGVPELVDVGVKFPSGFVGERVAETVDDDCPRAVQMAVRIILAEVDLHFVAFFVWIVRWLWNILHLGR